MTNPLRSFRNTADRLGLEMPWTDPTEVCALQAVGHMLGADNVAMIREAGYPDGAIVPWTAEDVCIYPVGKILSRQTGYRTDLDGMDLAGWNASHWVLADWAGDPFTMGPDRAVYHAPHGMGSWRHRRMFADLGTFFHAMTIWMEFFIEENAGDIFDGDFSVRADARATLETRIAAMSGDMDRDAFVKLACE